MIIRSCCDVGTSRVEHGAVRHGRIVHGAVAGGSGPRQWRRDLHLTRRSHRGAPHKAVGVVRLRSGRSSRLADGGVTVTSGERRVRRQVAFPCRQRRISFAKRLDRFGMHVVGVMLWKSFCAGQDEVQYKGLGLLSTRCNFAQHVQF